MLIRLRIRENDTDPTESGSTTLDFCKNLRIFYKQKHVSIHAGKGVFNKIFCAKSSAMPEYRYHGLIAIYTSIRFIVKVLL
jgi:hypothetical protein